MSSNNNRTCKEITLSDLDYPDRLRNIYNPPETLYLKGKMPAIDEHPVVGVVGTRKCTPYGVKIAENVSYELSMQGIIVATGLAKGIDTAAARGALRGGTPVIGVIGTGVDIVYPPENRALFSDVAEQGVIISEHTYGTAGLPHHFPMRNRIISGLSNGVAVIEAPQKSGALITARLALEQGKDVFALPGNVDSPACVGTNLLLREGAIPFMSAYDIIDEYKDLFDGFEKPIDNKAPLDYIDVDKFSKKMNESEKAVVNSVWHESLYIDEIIEKTNLSAPSVLATLTGLELCGIAKRDILGKWEIDKQMSKETNLVIVESPAKVKTISKYLGSNFKVAASMGHLRDLPKSKISVDIENGFKPDYQPVKARESTIKELRTAVKNSKNIYLATDPDREGESISWHLKELFKLSDDRLFRVSFNEITQQVVRSAIDNPRPINMDLVNAQQARRILDRIVGYMISPLLWKKIRRGLSAGRVQSVASRIVVDRENEIRKFVSEEYWLLYVDLSMLEKPGIITAAYYGTVDKKLELKSENDVNAVIDDINSNHFCIYSVKRIDKKRSSSPPFITSTLQQEASRRLNMTPRQTMAIAQQLYEGIDIKGSGTVGLITYMRTDSLRISDEAANDAKKFIVDTYGEKSYPEKPNRYKSKSSAQDAHEAIRPSSVFMTPESIKSSLKNDQYRLYRLIWSRFVASQMSPAIYDSVTVDVLSASHMFRANHSVIVFPGFTAVYEEHTDEEKEKKQAILSELKEQDPLKLESVNTEQKFTQPPSRYTEATLIRAMEETGVGRPSTYAPTISTILDREYVVKEGKFLRPTPLGEVVVGLMKDKFSDIVDLSFTARMEEQLDNIEKGNDDWQHVLGHFYDNFSKTLSIAEASLEGQRIKVPDEVSEEVCDLCGKYMVVKSGRFGRFLACPGYPDCTFTKPIVIEMPGKCPKCGLRILKRTSKKGYPYYACEQRECGFMTWDVPVADNCPQCGQTMFKLSGRGAKKPFCINEKCDNFLPEDKRGYKIKQKKDGEADSEKTDSERASSESKTIKKTATKETTKKTATKETTKKTAAKKTAKKKTTTKKTSGTG